MEESTIEETGPSEFGRWLTEQRIKANMSLDVLAEKSGVSLPQLYNLQSGRSQNPQSATRKRLEDALGMSAPQAVVEATAKSSTISGLGELTDFDPYRASDYPNVPGIYVLYDVTDRPVYVGQSDLIRRRMKQHDTDFWFKSPIVESAKYLEVSDGDLRLKIERTMIGFLGGTAVINKHHVRRNTD